MHRFKATIEFDCGEGDDAELVLKSNLRFCHGVCIKNIERISITPEEAIKQIKEVIDEDTTYGCVNASKIESILEKVI